MGDILKFTASVVGIAVVYYAVQLLQHYQRRKGLKVPPGPRGVPILGNLLQLLEADGDLIPVFGKWTKEFGPIMQFSVLGDKQVLLGTQKAAQDLLAKRGGRYSDRGIPHGPRYIDDHSLVLLDKDEKWTRENRVLHQALLTSLGSGGKWLKLMDDEAEITLRELCKTPDDFVAHFQRFSYGVLTRPFLGFSIESAQDPYLRTAEANINDGLRCFRSDAYPSNLFPFLRRLKFLPSLRKLEELKERNLRGKMELQERVRQQSRDNGAESVYRHFLENRKDFHDISDVELAASFDAILSGGTRTLYIGMMTVSFLMLLYPEWQVKMQAHIDEVIGPDRMPNMDDIPKMHLIRALVKEGIRYHSLHADVGIPHKLSEDDEYEGFFFEKGTAFHANTATILMNKEEYPDQKIFNPARWVDPSYPTYREPLTMYPNCKNFAPFGFGRRACPGFDLAERTLVVGIAKMIWAFDIRIPLGADGKPREIKIEYEWAPNKQPKEFPCQFVPRRDPESAAMRELLAGN